MKRLATPARVAIVRVVNEHEIHEWLAAFSKECKKRPEIKKEHFAEISMGWNPRLLNEIILSIDWWDAEREEKRHFSVIYPLKDWKDGMSGLLDDLLSRSIARKPLRQIPLPA